MLMHVGHTTVVTLWVFWQPKSVGSTPNDIQILMEETIIGSISNYDTTDWTQYSFNYTATSKNSTLKILAQVCGRYY